MSDSPMNPGAKWHDDETLGVVRPMVRDMLLGVPAFRQLSPEEQQQIAGQMVQVASYLANPDGVITESMDNAVPTGPVARAQADDPVDATKRRLSQAPGQVGKGFEAGAVSEGVEQFGALVQKVDFPQFVGGLIKNVFQAIVDSSIQQMQAYGELLANVAKTVDQYARDNISENNSRDWLANKYPDALGVDIESMSGELADGSDGAPQQNAKLTTTGDNPEEALTRISQDLAHLLPRPVTDLSDPAEEARLVQAARLEIARGRQQLLASMVMLGINRIVITDGLIHAKVIFDMRASDTAARRARASMVDQSKDSVKTDTQLRYGGWFTPYKASVGIQTSHEHMATVQSSVDDTSESKAEVKAKLSGEVRVNFKSDYFPMDKMASPEMIAAIQGNAKPPEKAVTGV